MENVHKFLRKNFYKIILIFLFLQPILDVVTGVMKYYLEPIITIGIVVRVLFLIFLFYYYFFVSKVKKKKETLFYLLGMFIYTCFYIFNIFYFKDLSVFLYEIQGLVRTLYFPLVLVLLYNARNDLTNISMKKLSYILAIYLALIFIPSILSIGFDSYAHSKVGSLGWFNSANEINAIIAILMPYFLIYFICINKNKALMIGNIILLLYTIFSIGTKMGIIALGIIGVYYLIKYLIKIIKEKKYKILGSLSVCFIILISLGFILIPKTSFYKNIKIHLDFLEVDNPIEIFTNYKVFDHFIFSSRLSFLEITRDNYYKSSSLEKIFGIGYIENYATDEVRIKTIEMDVFDILYRHGSAGFVLVFLPFIYMFATTLRKHVKELKGHKNTYYNEAFILSMIMTIFTTCLTGHVLTSPAVSIFVVILILNKNKEVEGENI